MNRRTPDNPRERALRLLARREHSAKELAQKLKRRPRSAAAADTLAGDDPDAPAPPDTAAIVADLAENQLQSNHRFALSLIRRRAADGYGLLRVRAELKSHNLTATDITAALDEADIDWQQVLDDLVQRQANRLGTHADRMKLANRLQQRGHAPDAIRRALRHAGTGEPGED